MKRNTAIYLSDMIENMERAQTFIKGMSYRQYSRDVRTQYAVMRCIEVIGEAAKHVPQSVRNHHARIPWKAIAGMRDIVIHAYFEVSIERVWLVVTDDIPKLKPLLCTALLRMKTSAGAHSDKSVAKRTHKPGT